MAVDGMSIFLDKQVGRVPECHGSGPREGWSCSTEKLWLRLTSVTIPLNQSIPETKHKAPGLFFDQFHLDLLQKVGPICCVTKRHNIFIFINTFQTYLTRSRFQFILRHGYSLQDAV